MFAVIFVVQPKPERFDDYLALAKFLKPKLEKIDGFIDNERFGSQVAKGRLLSLSSWRDEKAVIRWRTLGAHHEVQEKGRTEIFADYHLRVGEVTADTDATKGRKLTENRFDETEIGRARIMTITEFTPAAGEPAGADLASDLRLPRGERGGTIEQETFESITQPGKLLLLVSWRNAAAANEWKLETPAEGRLRHRHVRIVRDYGMADRREAPQYYPAVARTLGASVT
jgi:heme-degrading monooxygenase HmoA